jgi:hypothetical protein
LVLGASPRLRSTTRRRCGLRGVDELAAHGKAGDAPFLALTVSSRRRR